MVRENWFSCCCGAVLLHNNKTQTFIYEYMCWDGKCGICTARIPRRDDTPHQTQVAQSFRTKNPLRASQSELEMALLWKPQRRFHSHSFCRGDPHLMGMWDGSCVYATDVHLFGFGGSAKCTRCLVMLCSFNILCNFYGDCVYANRLWIVVKCFSKSILL